MKKLPSTTFKSGEQNRNAKANWKVVRFIRESYKPHEMTVPMLSEKTKLTQHCIRKILNGKHWPDKNFKSRQGQFRKLTFEQAQQIREMHALGYGYDKLGEMFGVSGFGTVRKIIKWKTYKAESKGGAAS